MRRSVGHALAFIPAVVASLFACAPDPDERSQPAVAALTTLAGTCPTGFAPHAGTNRDFSAGGLPRSFELLVPSSAPGPRPILFAFHGTSENGARFVARARLADFVARGFLVVAPDAADLGDVWPVWDAMRLPGHESRPNADLALFDAVLGCVAAHFPVDASRVYAAGHSAGGIFTNRLLRSRSGVLAGGIVASGVFDLTGPAASEAGEETHEPLSPTFALVTWGGDNDAYSGTTPGGVHVPAFSFVEQASLASKFYASASGVAQASCRGDDLGHAWLPLNAWFADVLLARPKGSPPAKLPPVPSGAPARCTTVPFDEPPLPGLVCAAGAEPDCASACQLIADCAVVNRTVGPTLAPELHALGFTTSSCDGCVARCGAVATTAADARVVACLAQRRAGATCGPGLEGAEPLLDAVNACCAGATGSRLCAQICSQLGEDSVAKAFFPVCGG